MTGILRTVLRHVPDALVPGTRPEGNAVPRETGSTAMSAAPVSRPTARLKVRGEARFAAEVAMEGLLHATIVHSTIARGRIASLDTAAAEAAPGVALVMTHRNAPRMKPPQAFGEGDGRGRQQPAHPAGRRRALERRGGGRRAGRDAGAGRPSAGLVAVTYAPDDKKWRRPSPISPPPGPRRAHPELRARRARVVEIGDAEKALAASDHGVDETYSTAVPEPQRESSCMPRPSNG